MRGFAAFSCGLLALVAGLVALPAAWVSHNIANEGGYVAFTEPLARDTAFNTAVGGVISEGVITRAALPEQFRPAATQAITTATLRVADTPGYVSAWNQTQRQSHRIMLGDQRQLDPELDRSNRLAVDLGPLATFIVKQVNTNAVVTVPAPKQLIVPVGGNVQTRQLEQVTRTPEYARNAIIVVAVMTALSLAFARRRASVVVGLGLCAVMAAGVLLLLSRAVLPAVMDRNSPPSPFAGAVLDQLVDRANASFGHWLLVVAVAGVVTVAVGGVARLGFSGRSTS